MAKFDSYGGATHDPAADESPEDYITSMQDLCDHFGAEEPAGLNRRIYKDTACGASISVCVRNPHNTRPDRVEMVVRNSTYQQAKYPRKRLELEVWIDADEHPHDAHIVKVTRNGEKVEDPEELAAYTKLYSIDDPTFFWGTVADVPQERTEVAGDASRHGWTVHLKPYHDPLMSDLPGLFIEELFVGDRKIKPYLGDHLREAYRDCQWFEKWEERVLSGLHFSCGNDRAEFWPQDPAEVRQGSPRTLADLKASATRFIEYDGRTKLVWDLRHHDEETDTEDRWVWVHNGRSLWRELTPETPIKAFTIQSIVEGSDATVDSDQFNIPCPTEKVNKWMEEMEEETSAIWDRDNHEWYYAFVDDQCVGQFKIGWDDDDFECFDPDNLPLTPREQALVIRWLNRGSTACLSHEKTRVSTTRVWVERFYQDIW